MKDFWVNYNRKRDLLSKLITKSWAALTNMGPILEHSCNSILMGIEVHISFSSGLPTGTVFHGDSNRLQWSKKLNKQREPKGT